MLIYAKFSYIFQFSNLVDIPWSVPKSERTKIWCLHITFIGLNTVPLCFGFCAQVACIYGHIEYRHPEQHPKFSHTLSLGLVLENLSTQVLSLSTHNKYQ